VHQVGEKRLSLYYDSRSTKRINLLDECLVVGGWEVSGRFRTAVQLWLRNVTLVICFQWIVITYISYQNTGRRHVNGSTGSGNGK